jgi:hypothetical protein
MHDSRSDPNPPPHFCEQIDIAVRTCVDARMRTEEDDLVRVKLDSNPPHHFVDEVLNLFPIPSAVCRRAFLRTGIYRISCRSVTYARLRALHQCRRLSSLIQPCKTPATGWYRMAACTGRYLYPLRSDPWVSFPSTPLKSGITRRKYGSWPHRLLNLAVIVRAAAL